MVSTITIFVIQSWHQTPFWMIIGFIYCLYVYTVLYGLSRLYMKTLAWSLRNHSSKFLSGVIVSNSMETSKFENYNWRCMLDQLVQIKYKGLTPWPCKLSLCFISPNCILPRLYCEHAPYEGLFFYYGRALLWVVW